MALNSNDAAGSSFLMSSVSKDTFEDEDELPTLATISRQYVFCKCTYIPVGYRLIFKINVQTVSAEPLVLDHSVNFC